MRVKYTKSLLRTGIWVVPRNIDCFVPSGAEFFCGHKKVPRVWNLSFMTIESSQNVLSVVGVLALAVSRD